MAAQLDLDDVCHGNPQAKEELDQLRASYIRALDERDRWREHAERRWAMRRELETLLGLEPDATFEEANFKKGVERLKKLVENEK